MKKRSNYSIQRYDNFAWVAEQNVETETEAIQAKKVIAEQYNIPGIFVRIVETPLQESFDPSADTRAVLWLFNKGRSMIQKHKAKKAAAAVAAGAAIEASKPKNPPHVDMMYHPKDKHFYGSIGGKPVKPMKEMQFRHTLMADHGFHPQAAEEHVNKALKHTFHSARMIPEHLARMLAASDMHDKAGPTDTIKVNGDYVNKKAHFLDLAKHHATQAKNAGFDFNNPDHRKRHLEPAIAKHDSTPTENK